MVNQYVILKDDGFLKENGKITSTIERAYIVSTKKIGQKLIDKYGGQLKEVYLSLNRPIYTTPLESVWLVKKTCQVNGLTVYGPFFTLKEAEELYKSEIVKSKNFPLLEFKEDHYSSFSASNRLKDVIELCKITKAKL